MTLTTEGADRRLRKILALIRENPGSDGPTLRCLGANLNRFAVEGHVGIMSPLVLLEDTGRATFDSVGGWSITDAGLEFLEAHCPHCHFSHNDDVTCAEVLRDLGFEPANKEV